MARVVARQLVGRCGELGRLERCLADVISGGTAPFALITGDAGVGKTRCLMSFVERVRADGVTVLVGGCLPLSHSELPYGPIAELLRDACRQAGAGRIEDWLRGRTEAVARLVPELPSGVPLDRPGPVGEQSGRLLSDILCIVERMATPGPLVLAVEDVHWADAASRDLLLLLLRATT